MASRSGTGAGWTMDKAHKLDTLRLYRAARQSRLAGPAPTAITVDEMDSQTKELSEFCGVLWREREIVERVLFKVLGQQLVLKSGADPLAGRRQHRDRAGGQRSAGHRGHALRRGRPAGRSAGPGAAARPWPSSPAPLPNRGAASWPSTATRCATWPTRSITPCARTATLLVEGATAVSTVTLVTASTEPAPGRPPAVEPPAVPSLRTGARRRGRGAGRGPGPNGQHRPRRRLDRTSASSDEFELGLRDVAVAAAYQASMRTAATIRQRSLAEFLR